MLSVYKKLSKATTIGMCIVVHFWCVSYAACHFHCFLLASLVPVANVPSNNMYIQMNNLLVHMYV